MHEKKVQSDPKAIVDLKEIPTEPTEARAMSRLPFSSKI